MEKNKDTAIASFIMGIFSIIPLINFILAPLSIYFGIKSLIKIKKEPEKYSGFAFALIGIIIAGSIVAFSLIGVGMCVAGSKDICSNMGLNYFAK